MSGIPSDVRPASVAVKEAADLLMLRWTDGTLGGGEAADAQVLQCLNTLDKISQELAEVEAGPTLVQAAREHAKGTQKFMRAVLAQANRPFSLLADCPPEVVQRLREEVFYAIQTGASGLREFRQPGPVKASPERVLPEAQG